MSESNPLLRMFSHTEQPVIISAPMMGSWGGTLAAHVSRQGGFGFIPGAIDLSEESPQLRRLNSELTIARHIIQLDSGFLPCGVCFITCDPSFSNFEQRALPMLIRHKVVAVWLSIPKTPRGYVYSHAEAIRALKEARIKVFVEVGTVAAAREAVRDGADVLVVQGIDASCHSLRRGAGVISLVPEVVALLERMGKSDQVAVVAAGGIADGVGVAAALALGAQGVAMGTRFLVADESFAPKWMKKQILDAKDGATATVKTKFFHDIHVGTIWPADYNGRALENPSYQDYLDGMNLSANIAANKAAREAGDSSRRTIWCGTGVGLINEEMPAADIVKTTREAAKERIRQMQSFLED